MSELTFVVHGKPRPKGSMRAVGPRGRGGMKEDNENSGPWRDSVAWAARRAMRTHADATGVDWERMEGPISIGLHFRFDKPKGAPKTRETFPVTRSTYDLDKLQRCIFDACTDSGVWRDDSQVVAVAAAKAYCKNGEIPGVTIVVRPFETGGHGQC